MAVEMKSKTLRKWTPVVLFFAGGFMLYASLRWHTQLASKIGLGWIALDLLAFTIILVSLILPDIRKKDQSLGRRSAAALIVYGIVIGLFLAEQGARALAKTSFRANTYSANNPLANDIVPDPNLGWRSLPNVNSQDANGYRNPAVPQQADIVALGDSETWGQNAGWNESWPQVLGQLAGESVYNMGISGYGPPQYWELTPTALTYSPRRVVVGVFLGNDLHDAYHMVYLYPQFSAYRSENPDPSWSTDPIADRGQGYSTALAQFRQRHDVRIWLRTNLMLLRFLMPEPGNGDADWAWALANPDVGATYENGTVRTVFDPGQRFQAVDLGESRNLEGQRLTEVFLNMAYQQVTSQGAQFLVVLIPTKESVYAKAMAGHMSPAYEQVVNMETIVRDKLTAYFEANAIPFVDSLPDLQAAVANNDVIYPPDMDEHFVAAGYAVIGQAAYQALSAP